MADKGRLGNRSRVKGDLNVMCYSGLEPELEEKCSKLHQICIRPVDEISFYVISKFPDFANCTVVI